MTTHPFAAVLAHVDDAWESIHRAVTLIRGTPLRRCLVAYYSEDVPEARAWLLGAKTAVEAALRELPPAEPGSRTAP